MREDDLNTLIPQIWKGPLDRAVEEAFNYYNKYTLVGLEKEGTPMNNIIPTQLGDVLDILSGLYGLSGEDQRRMHDHIKNNITPELRKMGLSLVWSDVGEHYILVSDSERPLGARG